MATPPSFPTIPASAGVGDRRCLLGGIAFMEGAPTWGVHGLGDWFELHVVSTGCMSRVAVATEHPAGYVALKPGSAPFEAADNTVARVLDVARTRVVSALRGMLGKPCDDRFLSAAIFTGRVRRRLISGQSRWVARPEPTAPLSGIVLSLFAVDILSNREMYDRELCVCDTCGRVSFDPRPSARRSCHEHVQGEERIERISGFTPRVTPSKLSLPAGKLGTG